MITDQSNQGLGSFRDPCGFVFRQDGKLFRAVTRRYQADYNRLMNSGLYAALTDAHMLVRHEESDPSVAKVDCYRLLEPEFVPFISYPYEWCFSQLKDAALLTLAIQAKALEFGMVLKDASAYNIQFLRGRPILIDTLSFTTYQEGEPWVTYRQFCQHFVAPLALMARADVRLSQLLRCYIDGVPLDLASRLLPSRTRWSLGLGTHIHLHARAQARYGAQQTKPAGRMSRLALQGLVRSLEKTIQGLHWRPAGTEWADYYEDTNYSEAALATKGSIVREFLNRVQPKTVWDLGANTGRFSRIAADRGIFTVAADLDSAAVEQNYLDVRARKDEFLLPLVLDLANPSPGLGFQNQERMSFLERGPADCVLALALIHHLAIGNNLPFALVARFMAKSGRSLIIEFVPKTDSQVKRLLVTREDVFPDYNESAFLAAFERYFAVQDQRPVGDSQRTLYLMTASGVERPA